VSHRSPELLVLGALVVLGGVTYASHRIGLPPAVGAFAAGLMLSGNRWTAQFDALVMPFRETFTVVFFVSLGMLVDPQVVFDAPMIFAGGLLLLVVVKAAAATIALRLTHLSWRHSLATGIGLAHVGEFAFVIVGSAAEAELLTQTNASRFIAVSLTSLMLSPLLLRFGLRRTSHVVAMEEDSFKWETTLVDAPEYALVIGIGPLGGRVAAQLETTGHEVCVIDRSPVNIQPFEQQGFHAVAGDAIERETLDRAFATRATLVVICVPDDTVCLEIIRLVRRINPRCQVVVRCHFQSNMQRLTKAGATKVISAEAQVGEALVKLLGDP